MPFASICDAVRLRAGLAPPMLFRFDALAGGASRALPSVAGVEAAFESDSLGTGVESATTFEGVCADGVDDDKDFARDLVGTAGAGGANLARWMGEIFSLMIFDLAVLEEDLEAEADAALVAFVDIFFGQVVR